MAVKMVFQIMIVLLCSIDAILFVQAAGLAINSSPCQASCGNVSIPYPFGIGAGCYVDPWFEVACINNNDSLGSPKPVLKSLNLEVLNISFSPSRNTVGVNYPTLSVCNNSSGSTENVELAKSPFIFSQSENIFIAMGCDNFASMKSSDSSVIGCRSVCDTSRDRVINSSSCHGYNCCQTTIASDLYAFNTTIEPINSEDKPIMEGCKSAFLVEEKWFKDEYNYTLVSNLSSIMPYVPVVLEWGVLDTSFISLIPIRAYNGSTYRCIRMSNRNSIFTCSCYRGFEGNPYLLHGCQGKVFVLLYLYIISLIILFFFVNFCFN
jgi:hypothetical protein